MKKFSSLLRFLLLGIPSILLLFSINQSLANQNRSKAKKIIFGNDTKTAAKIKGKVTGSISGNPKLYAFLIRTNSQISKELQALIALNYQVPR